LTDDDLSALKIPLGHRRILLAAVTDLGRRSATTGEAERRQLTILFSDLVGSTALSSRLDPEDMRDLIRAYQDACTAVVARYEGFVAKYMGDGILIYFGYPLAHEDDAERAVNTGLGIVEAIKELKSRRDDGLDLSVRIGIATGTVAVGDIVGEGASEEAAIVGEAPNLAARLQEIAEPSTQRLASGLFETADLGKHDLKGFADPIGAWAVIRSHRVVSRFEATRGENLTNLVGREEEVEILLRRWERAKAGEGQIVLISGEPGIGKSRLARELQVRIRGEALTRIRFQCSPYYTNTVLHPVIEQLERGLGFDATDGPDAKLDKLETVFEASGRPIEQAIPLVASLLSIPIGSRYPPLGISPQRQKEMTLEVLVDQLIGLARQQPVVFVFEDAHWIDPSTLELMELTIERIPGAAVLALIMYRPEFEPKWIGRAHVTPLILGRLEQRDCTEMVEMVAQNFGLAEALRDRIAAKTDGVPLFIEELTRSIFETTRGSLETSDAIRVPETLQDSLEARLDRLGSAKGVAQIGAAIGRTFNFDMLARIVADDDRDLEEDLGTLAHSGLITVRGEPPQSAYTFSHALVQDTAYNLLLRTKRTELHGRIVSALEKDFPEIVSAEPESLAHHCAQATLNEKAIDYWLQAGQRAMSRSANIEANGHLRKGLAVLENLPKSPDRDRLELMLQTTLGMSLIASEGFAAPDVEHAFRRAHLLCHDVGDTPELIPVLWGTWWFHEVRAELETAGELAEQLYDLAQRQQDQGLMLPACRAMGQTSFWRGEFTSTRQYLEQAIAIYEPDQHRSYALLYGQDPGVATRNFLALCLWILGYPDQALTRIEEALALEAKFTHPFSHAFALSFASWLHIYRREVSLALDQADAALTLSREQGFPFFMAYSTILRGSALSEQGEAETGIAEMRQALDMYRMTGANSAKEFLLSLVAEARGKIGQFEEGLRLVTEALAESDARESRFCKTELYRLKGKFLLAQDTIAHAEEAETIFRDAIEIARSQNAKSWELRAATSLARLWHSQNKTTEARDLLAPVYGWFTEGFDTADLKEAKALLDELS
jgi:predicted ATPase/class 3 adenylate cyclase